MINLSLNKKIIIFGFIFTFFSSFGQSFFLGLFNPSIRNDLNISHGQFGSIYALATICSSLTLIWFGKKIDEYKLLNYSMIVVFLLLKLKVPILPLILPLKEKSFTEFILPFFFQA